MILALPAVLLSACNFNEDPDGAYVPPTEQGESPEIVSGYVCAPSGLTLPLAYVYIPIDENGDDVEDFRHETHSDDAGQFEFENLPAGTYTLHVIKGSYDIVTEFEYDGVDRMNLGGQCIDVGDLKLAVVDGDYDSIEEILDYLGFPYDFYDAAAGEALVGNATAVASYDAVFLNCGGAYYGWSSAAMTGVRDYAMAGGKVYASDWAYITIESAFPEMVQFFGEATGGSPTVGNVAMVTGEVLDPVLRDVMGEQVELYYQLGAWVVAEDVGEGSSVVVQGDAPTASGTIVGAPLTIRAPQGKGSALYTTFHNESQATADAKQILFEFVLNL